MSMISVLVLVSWLLFCDFDGFLLRSLLQRKEHIANETRCMYEHLCASSSAIIISTYIWRSYTWKKGDDEKKCTKKSPKREDVPQAHTKKIGKTNFNTDNYENCYRQHYNVSVFSFTLVFRKKGKLKITHLHRNKSLVEMTWIPEPKSTVWLIWKIYFFSLSTHCSMRMTPAP